MIEVERLTISFEDVMAVSEIDLVIEAGEFVTIVGPSGCGKTSTSRSLDGQVRTRSSFPRSSAANRSRNHSER